MLWNVLTAISVSTVALAAVAWLIRSIITHFLSKDVEAYKINLQRESDREIERHRAELRKLELEHEVRFSKLHEKVFETIAELYALLTDAHFAMSHYLEPIANDNEPPNKEREGQAVKAYSKFNEFFKKHEIYFDPNLCEMLEKFGSEWRYLYVDSEGDEYKKYRGEGWQKAWNHLTTSINKIKKSLQDEFRRMISIEAGQIDNLSHQDK
jgi:hypothetical protein